MIERYIIAGALATNTPTQHDSIQSFTQYFCYNHSSFNIFLNCMFSSHREQVTGIAFQLRGILESIYSIFTFQSACSLIVLPFFIIYTKITFSLQLYAGRLYVDAERLLDVQTKKSVFNPL